MDVPILDLRAQHAAIRDRVLPAVLGVIESQRFILGEEVEALERSVAEVCGVEHGVAVASGTDALLLSLKTLDLQPGDEVITSPFTFFATAGAIHNAGGRPVFADIDPRTFNLSPDRVRETIGPRTRAVVPVHLYGQMAAMDELTTIAQAHGAAVVEDAAQALGARRRAADEWRAPGQTSRAAAFSFFPTKNLGGWGDGGLIVTRDGDRAARLRKLRTHGGAKQYHHEEIGTNSRLDALQAAVLRAKLPSLASWNAARRRHAAAYTDALADLEGVVTPTVDATNEHVFHQYTLRVRERDRLRAHLAARGVGTAVYYPRPLHLQECFAALGYGEGDLPEAERACREVVSLPVYPELTSEQQAVVIDAVREFYR